MLAFQRALDLGADGVELDVRLTRDQQPIVLHDPDLSRVSGGRHTQVAQELSLPELQALDLGQGQRVPTLDEVLNWAADTRCLLNVELKSEAGAREGLAAQVAASVRRSSVDVQQLLISSFEPALLGELVHVLPDVARAWLFDAASHLAAVAQNAAALGLVAVHPQHSLLEPDTSRKLRTQVPLLNTWTVNDGERARALARLAVDTLITDRPQLILAALTKQPSS